MSIKPLHRLALGTAQFGLDYGLTSGGRPVPDKDVAQILACAGDHGVRVLDTAHAYGHAERLLGELKAPGADWRIVTKIPAAESGSGNVLERARRALEGSLERLGADQVYGLLLHDSDDLLGNEGDALYDLTQMWKAQGKIVKFGISVYEAREIEDAYSRFELDMVQLPLSVFDQRLLRGGVLGALARGRVEIHARSVFLQGLLLMDEDALPPILQGGRDLLRRYRRNLKKAGISPLGAALAFVRELAEIEHVIIGVHTVEHLRECLAAWEEPCGIDFADFACNDKHVVDPRTWG